MSFNWIKKFGNGLSSTNDLVLPLQTTSDTSINIETGIPNTQEQDPDSGGQYVKRAEMNGILQALSDPLFDRQGGGQITFDDAYSTQNGGYSAGTVLYCASNNSYQRSLINSNTYNFIDNTSYINDGTHWVTQSSFMPDITDNTSTGTVSVNGVGGLTVRNHRVLCLGAGTDNNLTSVLGDVTYGYYYPGDGSSIIAQCITNGSGYKNVSISGYVYVTDHTGGLTLPFSIFNLNIGITVSCPGLGPASTITGDGGDVASTIGQSGFTVFNRSTTVATWFSFIVVTT